MSQFSSLWSLGTSDTGHLRPLLCRCPQESDPLDNLGAHCECKHGMNGNGLLSLVHLGTRSCRREPCSQSDACMHDAKNPGCCLHLDSSSTEACLIHPRRASAQIPAPLGSLPGGRGNTQLASPSCCSWLLTKVTFAYLQTD